FALPRDLVDLIDVDDPALRAVQVEVSGLDESEQDVLDVLADVTSLGEACRIRDRERDIEDPRERLGEKGLAATRRADEQNVGFAELDVVDAVPRADSLVVVVDRDREHALGFVLADDVLVEDLVDAPRARDLRAEAASFRRLHELFVDDPVFLRLFRAHESVPLAVAADFLDFLPSVLSEELRDLVDERLELFHLDENVGRISAEATRALVDHDPRVRQGVTLPLASRGE